MKRRTLLQAGFGLSVCTPLCAAMDNRKLDAAIDVLRRATASGEVTAASMYVRHGDVVLAEAFGAAESSDAVFLLASISKPISAAAVMRLYDAGMFKLDDRVCKFIPGFTGQGRDQITIRQLLTHTSGLPDQLPENARLRAAHAPLPVFVQHALRTPLLFEPGSQYRYSSMGILIASDIASRLSGKPFATLVEETVFRPLDMQHSAFGTGHLQRERLMRCQVEHAAPESGAGDEVAKAWDWNSRYWRELGAPWGGAHGSAVDVARFLNAFLGSRASLLQPATVRMMITNQNPPGLRPRGLGFDLGSGLGGPPSSTATFGHSGSTGTVCWADPTKDSVCVVLTTLPSGAARRHPRDQASALVGEAVD